MIKSSLSFIVLFFVVFFAYSGQDLNVTMDSCSSLNPEVNVFLPDTSLPGSVTSDCGGSLNTISDISPLSTSAVVKWKFYIPDIPAFLEVKNKATFTIIKNSATPLVAIDNAGGTTLLGSFTLNAGDYIEVIMNGGGIQLKVLSLYKTFSMPCSFHIDITESTPTPTPEPTATPTPEPTAVPVSIYPTPDTSLPGAWKTADIGTGMILLQAKYYGGTYTIEGYDPAKMDNGFHFVYQTMSSNGNGEIIARVSNAHAGTEAGVMIRESLEPDSPFAMMILSGTGGSKFSSRTTSGGSITGRTGTGTIPYWVKLVKDGKTFTGSVSPDGITWTTVKSETIDMAGDIYIGLCVDGSDHVFMAEFNKVDVSYAIALCNGRRPPPVYFMGDSFCGITAIEDRYVVLYESFYETRSMVGGMLININGNKIGTEFGIGSFQRSQPFVAKILDSFIFVSAGDDIFCQRFDNDGNKIGDEFVINTYTENIQGYPVAAQFAGGFIVAWVSEGQDGSSDGIYGQCFDVNGDRIGNEFRINTYKTNAQTNPAIATLTDGFIVVWQSEGQDGSNYGIYGQRFDSNGNKNGNEFLVNTRKTDAQINPEVIKTAEGFVVIWQSNKQDGSGYGIYGQRFDNNGNKAGNEFLINTHTNNNQTYPSAVAIQDGFIVVWQSVDQDGNSIRGQHFDVNGDTIGQEFIIGKYTIVDESKLDIAAIDNSFVVVWHSKEESESYFYFVNHRRRYTIQDLHVLLAADDGSPLPGGEWVNSPIVDVHAVKVLPYAPGTSGIDPATFEYSIDGGAWQAGDEMSFFTEGSRNIAFRAEYPEGGYCFPESTDVMIDVTAPVVSMDMDISGTTMTFTATADDMVSGVDESTWSYSVDNGPLHPGNTVIINEIRNCEIYFEVKDRAGNPGSASESITPDIIPPVISATGTDWTNAPAAYARATAADTGTNASGIDPATWCYMTGSTGDWVSIPGVTSPDEEVSVGITGEGTTTVYFMVSDNAGNTAEAACEVQIDRTPPGIFPGIPVSVFVRDSVQFALMPFCYDSSSGIKDGSLEYAIDSYEPGIWYPVQEEIDVQALAEGGYTFYFRAEDMVGNAGMYEEGLAFTVDRTDPVLGSITIRANGIIIEENGFSPADTVNADITAADTYGTGGTGIIAGYLWAVSDDSLPAPVLENTTAGGEDIVIEGLDNRLHYLYVCAVDGAGNRSSTAERIIRVDAETPGEPVIESLTHPYAFSEEDAVAFPDAVFTIVPGTIGLSGLTGYAYELTAGTSAGSSGIIASGITGNQRIEFPGLEDNPEGEFYFLSVSAVAGNGRESTPAVYAFRIDTTPPQDLVVKSATHCKPDTWYASGTAVFTWNRPLDFTGIKSYYYTAGTTPLLPDPVPEGYEHTGEWTPTALQTVSVELPGITDPPEGAGQVYFAVCAEDYSGNRQYDEISVLFDIVKPWLDGEITVIPDQGLRSVFVAWPEPEDNVPDQVSHCEVKLFTVEVDGTLTDASCWIPKQPGEVQEHEFEGLSEDPLMVYAVIVKVLDKAGNEMQYAKGFKLNGETVELAVPFTDIICGYVVEGQYSSSPVQQKAFLKPAAGLHLEVNGIPAESIDLPDRTFSAEGVFEAGTNPSITYTATIGGYSFEGTGITISRTEGLTFHELTLTIPIAEREIGSFVFADVGVTSPPQILFEPAASAVPDGFSFRSMRNLPIPEECWLFNDIFTTGLGGHSWLLKDGVLDLTEINETKPFRAYIIESDETHTPLLPVSDVSITPGRQTGEGEVLPGFTLEAAGNLFLVRQALVRGEKLVILKAELLLAGLTEDEIIIENFSVDVDGTIAEEPGFTHTPFTLTDNGVSYTVTGLHFTGNQLVITDGSIDYPGSSVPLTGAILTADGVTGGTIGFFDEEFFGFRVTSDSGVITGEGIVFANALLYLPGSFVEAGRQEPVQIPLHGLTVGLADKTILAPGTGSCNLPLLTPYGDGIQMKGLTLNATGLYASLIEVTLPGYLTPEKPAINLVNLPLFADGTVGESDEYELLACGLPGAEPRFQLYGSLVKMTSAGLRFGYVDTAFTEDYSPEVVSFEGFTVTRTDVVEPGVAGYTVSLSSGGWNFELENLTLDRTGIHGTGKIQLPYEFGYRTISFPDFRVFPDGSFVTGASTDEVYVRIHNWMVRATNVVISGDTIALGQAAVMLYSMMGWGELAIPDVVLGSDGSIVSCGVGNTPVDFLAVNGFRVGAAAYHFTGDGLYLAGDVYFPKALGDDVHATFSDKIIALESDGCIVTPEVTDQTVTYNVAGFDVEAEDFYFDRDGLTIGSSTVTIPVGSGIDVVFPAMQFYPDGEIKVAGQSFEGFSFPLGLLEFGVTGIGLNEEGVNIKAFIKLPPNLGEDSVIYFDKLTIHADGSITSDVVVSHFNFEAFGCLFDFKQIGFDADTGFFIGEAVITLPEALDSKSIRITDLCITPQGEFVLGGLGVDPFEMWGYVFYLDNISFEENTLSLSGGLRFPYDFFIEQLSGVRVDFDEISYNFSTHDVTFSVSCDETFSFPLIEGYTVEVTGITISNLGVGVTQATMQLPEELGIGSVGVQGIFINMKTWTIDYDAIVINDIDPFPFLGCTFTITTISFSESEGLNFAGTVKLPEEGLPDGIAGRTLTIAEFRILPGPAIGDISASISGFEISLFNGMIDLTGGSLSLAKLESELFLGCSGSFTTGEGFPENMRGKTLTVHEFEVRLWDGGVELTKFDASTIPLEFPLLGLQVENAVIRIAKETGEGGTPGGISVTVSGYTDNNGVEHPLCISVDPAVRPSFIREDDKIMVTLFRFDPSMDWELDASLRLTGTRELFAGIDLVDTDEVPVLLTAKKELDSEVVEFALSGTLVFDDTYPEGIAGTKVEITKLRFDSNWEPLETDITVYLGGDEEIDFYGIFTLSDVVIHIADYILEDDEKILSFEFGGKAELNLPDDLAIIEFNKDPVIEVEKILILADGTVKEVSISATGLDMTILQSLEVKEGTLEVIRTETESLEFTFTGDLTLSEDMSATLNLEPEETPVFSLSLVYDTEEGMTEFGAGLASPFHCDLFPGIRLTFSSIDIDTEGIGMACSLEFTEDDSPFPEGLKGVKTNVGFAMDWDGKITELSGTIPEVTIKLIGFTAEVTNLTIDREGISFAFCTMILPEVLNSYEIGIKNAGYKWDGEFYGEITIPVINIKIAGFTLKIYNPDLSFDPPKLAFSKVTLVGPAFLKSFEITLRGVSITKDGIEISGGRFSIPDFTIAGGLWFRDLSVELAIETVKGKKQYFIQGEGKVIIPGAGTFETEISFITKSKTYPWGIKRVYFEYTISGMGIPIASTGLYLNKIRGGLAFGPPDELPDDLQPMFDEGTRIQMGVSITDATKSAVKGDVDVWVDITDWDWAFEGKISVLSGIVKARIAAALTKKGFYGDLKVSISFVKGRVYIYIFKHPKKKKTVVSGGGSLQFGLKKGCIWKKKIKILCWKKTIYMPPFSFWLPGIHAEFGLFTKSGKEVSGFKGYVRVPLFGKVGVFVPKEGSIKIGSVSKYKLYTPTMKSASRSQGLSFVPDTAGDSITARNDRIMTRDTIVQTGVIDTYNFGVPSGIPGGEQENGLIQVNRSLTGSMYRADGAEPEDEPGDEPEVQVERLVFFVAYMEGEPVVKAVSPTGKVFMIGDPGIEVEYYEDGYGLAILDPEPGEWKVEVSNVMNSESYDLEVFGKTAIPEIEVETPAYNGEHVGSTYTVKGNVTLTSEEPGHVTVYLAGDKENFVGEEIATVDTDPDGYFEAVIDTAGLSDGEYALYGEIADPEENASIKAFAPGTIVVYNTSPLMAVEELIAADNGAGGISLAFADPNGDRTKGFHIYVTSENSEGTKEETINIGYVINTTIPGFHDGDEVTVQVTPYDELNREGTPSPVLTIIMGEGKDDTNNFTITENDITLDLEINTGYSGTLTCRTPGYRITGTAYDWMDARVSETPEGLAISFGQALYNIAQPETEVSYSLLADESLAPGTYHAALVFENRGNSELAEEVGVTVTVTYPDVVLNNILPEEWNTLDDQVVELFGDHFYQGTRVFIDDEELTVSELEQNYIKVTVPAGIPGGTRLVRVIGPGGDEAEIEATVEAPCYSIDVYKSKAEAIAGDTEHFYFTIRGENRFDGYASFQVGDAPAGWGVAISPQTAGVLETVTVSVEIPTGAQTGTYPITLISDQGDIVDLTMTVTATYPNPHISSVAPYSGFPGDEITIYGYGFGDAGTAMINDTGLEVISYSRDMIQALIPQDAETGNITVIRDSVTSNPHIFYVKARGFTIYAEKDDITLQPGESETINLYIKGYEDYVNLEVTTAGDGIQAVVTPGSVVPNGMCELTVTAAGNAAFDLYQVTVTGTGVSSSRTKTVNVIVGQAFAITTEILPKGMEETSYRAEIIPANGDEPVAFGLEDGDSLPYGLAIGNSGIITGTPKEAGTWMFTVIAEDLAGRTAEKDFTIIIEENAWAQENKGPGRTRHNGVKSPADSRTMWVSDNYAGAKEILTGKSRVFVLTDTGVTGLEQNSGKAVFTYPGVFSQWAYANETLYLLDDTGVFHAVESLYGNVKWTRENTGYFTTDGNSMYLAGDGHIIVINMEDGTYPGTIESQLQAGSLYLWQNGELLKAGAHRLEKLTAGGWMTVYEDEYTESLYDTACDEQGTALLTEYGRLVLLDADGNKAAERDTGIEYGMIALGSERITIASTTETAAYSRADLAELFYNSSGCTVLATAEEKVFAGTESGLYALNGYDGSGIWAVGQGNRDLALAGEFVYALDSAGIVTCYNGPDNIYPPATTLTTSLAPDEETGYITGQATLELKADDTESYVAGTWYRRGQGEEMEYTVPFIMPEGEYSFLWYSKDNHGYREQDNITYFKVDYTDPVSEITITGTKGEGIYYLTETTISLAATDNYSGVEMIEYSLDGAGWIAYTEPLDFTGECRHLFVWRAKDMAGNYEQARQIEFGIDLYSPVVSHRIWSEPGITVVYLEAEDSSSGIRQLAYYTDGILYENYIDPIVLTEPGEHRINYMATDNAGRSSVLETVTVEVTEFTQGEWVENLKFAYYLPGRELVRNVQVDEQLYGPVRNHHGKDRCDDHGPGFGGHNKIKALPDYLVGADFIRTHVADRFFWGKVFITFTAKADIDVFIMKHKRSWADLSGWTLVEEDFPVEPAVYFRGGADIYTRHYRQGETVTIPGTCAYFSGWGNLVFIQYALGNYIRIINPPDGTGLKPFTKQRYGAAILGLAYDTIVWHRQVGNGDREELGTGLTGEMQVPFVEKTTGMELRVSLYDDAGVLIADRTAEYVIKNEFEIMLLNPGPGTEVLPGEELPLVYTAKDAEGKALPVDKVAWAYSTDMVNWTGITGNTFTVSSLPGRVSLRGEAQAVPGVVQHADFFVDVVAEYGETAITFGKAEGAVHTLGETAQLHGNGKYYGFNVDHSDMTGVFMMMKPNRGMVYETNIRLKKDGKFEYTTGNGVYLVKAVFGPVDGKGYYYRHHHDRNNHHGHTEMAAFIEGKNITIPKWGSSVRVYEVLVTVKDGILTLTGTEGLPLMELDVKKLTGEEAANWKGWHPHTGPPGWRDTEKSWNNDGKGGSK